MITTSSQTWSPRGKSQDYSEGPQPPQKPGLVISTPQANPVPLLTWKSKRETHTFSVRKS